MGLYPERPGKSTFLSPGVYAKHAQNRETAPRELANIVIWAGRLGIIGTALANAWHISIKKIEKLQQERQ